MGKMSSLALCGLLLAMLTGIHGTVVAQEVEVTHRSTNAKPIKKAPPRYPPRAARSGTEGWVLLSYVIKEDGSVGYIEILDTSIDHFFNEVSRDAVKKWTFEPATLDGQPVQQAKTKVRMLFLMQDSNGRMSPVFSRLYDQVLKSIQDGDLEAADKSIKQLESRKKRLIAEVGYLDVLKGQYWITKGVEWRALRHLERALTIADKFPGTEFHRSLLRQVILLEIRQNDLYDALKHYRKLVKLEGGLPIDDPIRYLGDELQAFLDSPIPLVISGKILKPCATCREGKPFWRHSLYRSKLSISQIDGKIEEFKLLCGFQNVTIAYEPDMTWSVKEEWGKCDIHVYGDIGTTFRLIEYQETEEE